MRRTKIIATIGPASENPIVLQKIIKAGMNVARLNFSHGTHAWHAKTIRTIRRLAKKQGETIAILGDLQGPKIRLGVLPEKGIELKNGETVTLPVTYRALYKDLKKGDRVYIDDGILEVIFVKGALGTITVKVTNGGLVTSHKGMNFPDSTLSISSLTAKDKEDIIFGVQQGVDWLALSFVTSQADVRLLRRLIKVAATRYSLHATPPPRIIVKIEKHEAIDRFDEILAQTDAVMVARGDLGVETEAADVPIRQKEIIAKCRIAGKPVVVATQMLDSMIRNPRPTRAEVSDVANAVCDHTDAVMLSGESAGGKYPVQAVAMMAKIVTETEASPFDDVGQTSPVIARSPQTTRQSFTTDVSRALAMLAVDGQIDAIVASLEHASFAEQLMSARPELTMYLACPTDTETRQTNIRWGVRPFTLKIKHQKQFTEKALAELKKRKWIKKGMKLAIVAGGEHGTGFDILQR